MEQTIAALQVSVLLAELGLGESVDDDEAEALKAANAGSLVLS